ncbi:hypothetical protein XM38_001880 [Halomicronema hongdechloris C2206]|uniref:Peptide chain release factor 1 n=1 Tax=Halomicronema hongdechloris C2206 TaxID=1641165 RepID=A0A1Z3HG70_9CYAN|nr:hypothetical protein [Halomicronema hongdechloris]ASC69261.1 hypothetical protein XM38_001880 [Halomicronema hongdechloris C2206]
MRDPLWRLKSIPWVILLQNALLTVIIATGLDLLLLQGLLGLSRTGLLAGSGRLFPLAGLLGLILTVLVGAGIGALAVILLDRFFTQILPDAATLWALVACLVLMLWLKSIIPLSTFLVRFSYPLFVGLLLGVFVKGKRHWRY